MQIKDKHVGAGVLAGAAAFLLQNASTALQPVKLDVIVFLVTTFAYMGLESFMGNQDKDAKDSGRTKV